MARRHSASARPKRLRDAHAGACRRRACPPRVRAGWLAAAAASASVSLVFPAAAPVVDERSAALTFLAWAGLRLIGAATAWQRLARVAHPRRTNCRSTPSSSRSTTRQTRSPELIAALRQLDYPPEKLQIILALEPDDMATRDALLRLNLGPPFEIVIAPGIGPRTKPKALNAALAFARGTFIGGVRRRGPSGARSASPRARRVPRTSNDIGLRAGAAHHRQYGETWLARIFTAEYAGLFDVLLPGLAQRRLPLPLGGSSNHFRTQALREVGGWDPYNVTEDADLGMRLARLGL